MRVQDSTSCGQTLTSRLLHISGLADGHELNDFQLILQASSELAGIEDNNMLAKAYSVLGLDQTTPAKLAYMDDWSTQLTSQWFSEQIGLVLPDGIEKAERVFASELLLVIFYLERAVGHFDCYDLWQKCILMEHGWKRWTKPQRKSSCLQSWSTQLHLIQQLQGVC